MATNNDPYVHSGVCEAITKRLDERISNVESIANEIKSLSLSVERLATTIEHMLEDQESQESRLERIEKHDGEMWRTTVKYILTTIVGIIIGFAFRSIGLF